MKDTVYNNNENIQIIWNYNNEFCVSRLRERDLPAEAILISCKSSR